MNWHCVLVLGNVKVRRLYGSYLAPAIFETSHERKKRNQELSEQQKRRLEQTQEAHEAYVKHSGDGDDEEEI
jgi:hypothetical protein